MKQMRGILINLTLLVLFCNAIQASRISFGQSRQVFCERAQNDDKVINHKVCILDTNYVKISIEAFYEGCSKKTIDSTYSVKWKFTDGNKDNWELFYDEALKIKYADYIYHGDTCIKTQYYRNGRKKQEDWERSGMYWIYSAKWCENGQKLYGGSTSHKTYEHEVGYYCNGKKEWEGNFWNGRVWGTFTRWYESGIKKSEEHYTEFDLKLAEDNTLENKLLSASYWDEQGNITSAHQNNRVRIDTYAAPIYISKEEAKGLVLYSDIKGQKEYDNTMSLFREKVYSLAKPDHPCKCNVGLVYVGFTINKEGLIENVKLDGHLEDAVDKTFLDAVKKIGKWPPALQDGKPVEVIVKVGLELERIK